MNRLDLAVAKAIGRDRLMQFSLRYGWHPSTNWGQGGPLLCENWYAIKTILVNKYGSKWADNISNMDNSMLVEYMTALVESKNE